VELDFPLRYDKGYDVLVHVAQDRDLGTPNGDVSLITDPTQAILAIEVTRHFQPGGRLFIMRIQDFVQRVCSARVNVQMPWEEWGRGAVTMKMPKCCGKMTVHVHDTHVVVSKTLLRDYLRYDSIRTFDFGRQKWSTLPLWDGEGGGAVRSASFWGGKELMAVPGEGLFSRGVVKSLGNGSFFRHATPGGAADQDAALRVLELI